MSYLYKQSDSPIKKIESKTFLASSGHEVSLNTQSVISGSEISYIPSNDADYVMYDFSFTVNWEGVDSDSYTGGIGGTLSLQEYNSSTSSWEHKTGYIFNIRSYSNSSKMNHPYNPKFMLPSWQGEKKFRMTAECSGSEGGGFTLHEYSHSKTSYVSPAKQYIPSIVKCYSLVNNG